MKENKRRRSRNKGQTAEPPYLSIPYKQLRSPFPAYEIASAEVIEDIHCASMEILKTTGISFQDPEALDLWEKAGAKVNKVKQHVWIDEALLMDLVGQAPNSFTMRSRNEERNRFIGENAINFFQHAGMVFANDLDNGRRPGKKEDFINFNKLNQMTNIMHFAPIQTVVMHDVAVHEKHLQNYLLNTTLTDKPVFGISHGRIIANDVLDMAKIVFGQDLKPELGPVTGGNINANSPLNYDERMLGGLITFARAGQINVITPFILAGAMSPITIAAAVAQQNAEALAGIAFSQIVRSGAPVVYGGFTTNVDMKSGAPAFGTPEGAWALLVGAQLARHYNLPYRGSGSLNTSSIADAQASSESMWSLWPCILGHTNLIIHAVGWLESGLTASFEKYVMDVENVAMMQHFLQGPEWSEDAFALDSINSIGSAGHHLGTEHTMARYKTAFYPNFLHDRRNFETWEEAGSEDTLIRANKIWKEVIASYKEPAMDANMKEALEDFVALRSQELENVELYG